MNDLTGLTHPTLRLRMRADLFSDRNRSAGIEQQSQLLEKCDGCGAVMSLYLLEYTGVKFLCFKCTPG
jgi:hypothetical protein